MDVLELLRAVANTRAKVALLIGIAFAAYVPHALSALTTHVGLPSATTLLVSAFWPAFAVFLLYLTARFLPGRIGWAVRALHTSQRRWAAGIAGISVLVISVVAVLFWPELRLVRGLASLALLVAIVAGGIALMFVAARRESRASRRSGEPAPHGFVEIAAHARAATNVVVASSSVIALLVAYGLMARLPLGVGGLREPCVRVAVLTTDLPSGVRDVLLGDLAKKPAPSGLELTLPARILRNDATEAFLWMSTGRGVTIPQGRIGGIVDFDDVPDGCWMSSSQIAREVK
jgi:hypothetical protein